MHGDSRFPGGVVQVPLPESSRRFAPLRHPSEILGHGGAQRFGRWRALRAGRRLSASPRDEVPGWERGCPASRRFAPLRPPSEILGYGGAQRFGRWRALRAGRRLSASPRDEVRGGERGCPASRRFAPLRPPSEILGHGGARRFGRWRAHRAGRRLSASPRDEVPGGERGCPALRRFAPLRPPSEILGHGGAQRFGRWRAHRAGRRLSASPRDEVPGGERGCPALRRFAPLRPPSEILGHGGAQRFGRWRAHRAGRRLSASPRDEVPGGERGCPAPRCFGLLQRSVVAATTQRTVLRDSGVGSGKDGRGVPETMAG
jgi:hypothetical protein